MTRTSRQAQVVLLLPEPVHKGSYFAYSSCCALLLILGASTLILAGDLHAVEMVVLFSFLAVIAEQRDRLFGDETSISCGIIVAMASVATFSAEGSLVGPLVCAATAGIYWSHLRERAFAKIAINSFSMATAAFTAAITYSEVVRSAVPSPAFFVLGSVAAVSVFWVVNSFTIAIGMVLLRGGNLLEAAWMLIRSETEMMVFAVAGAGCGYLIVAVSPWIGFAALIGVLVAADRLVIRSKSRPANLRRRKLVGDLVQIGLGALALAMVIALAFTQPEPALAPLALLLCGVAAVLVLTSGAGIERSALGTALVGLVAVFASPPILTPTLVVLVGGIVTALRARTTFARRSMCLAVVVFPTSAVVAVKASLPLRVEDGFLSMLGLAVAVSATMVIVGMIAVIIAVSARVGRLVPSVGVGYLATDAWLFPVGIFVAIVSAYSIVGGVLVAVACLVLLVFIDRRRASTSAPITGSLDEGVTSDGARLAAVVAALHDRPGTSSHLKS